MIELYLLEQLNAFAKEGTLSGAAKQLHISQPALTRSMKKLEEETGMSLFNREGRKITLNEGGKIAAKHAALILNQEEEMMQDLSQWERSQHTVSIGSCAPLPLSRIMPALQMQFQGKSITTEILDHDEDLLARLKSGDMQAVILHENPGIPSIYCQRYLHESICVYVPASHPLASFQSVTLHQLSQYNILISRNIGFWLPLCQSVLPSSNLLIQDSIDAMDELAESSSTPMFNSDAMMIDGYDSGDRIAIPIEDACMHAIYYAACMDYKKENFRVLFNAVRNQALQDHALEDQLH